MMEWNGVKSNTEAGDKFVLGMIGTSLRWEKAREKFTAFVKSNGFAAWHIHDGWVKRGYEKGSHVLDSDVIRICWIIGHEDWSHSAGCPNVGDKMVVIRDSPKGDESKPFNLYCYDVVSRKDNSRIGISDEIELKRTGIKSVVFSKSENEYQYFVEPVIYRPPVFNFLK